jgi:hypothetical protein
MMNGHGTAALRFALRTALIAVMATAALGLVACGSLASDGGDRVQDVVRSIGSGGEEIAPEEGADASMPSPDIDIPAPGTGEDASQVPEDERYVIRTVGIRVEVDDVESAVESIRNEVDRLDGVVIALQVSTEEDTPIYRYEGPGSLDDGAPLKGYVTVRVPAEELSSFIETVGDLGTVQRQSSDESDVTQEHIDLSARLDNLNSQEERLREFFDRAENVEEMLQIERELGRVRGDIESLTARIAYLERQAAMATVTVELSGVAPVIRPTGSDWGFVDAITTGIRGLVNTINVMIIAALSLLPLIIVGSIIALVVRAIVRKRRAARSPNDFAPADSAAASDRVDEGIHE